MVYYEVNLEVDPIIYHDFNSWLSEHIQEVLSLPGFLKADILEDQDQPLNITVLYQLHSFAELENYFNCHAATMREKTIARFGEKVKAKRRVLTLTKTLVPVTS